MNERLEPRIRILLGSSIAIGPGKAALLEAIGDTGSIAAAGRRMGMSYRRAWLLAKTMNACFRKPLVEATKGGVGGGGARLTPVGREVLALYRAMEDHAATAVVPDMEKLRSLMADSRRRTEPGVRYEQNTISGLISACGQFAEYSGL